MFTIAPYGIFENVMSIRCLLDRIRDLLYVLYARMLPASYIPSPHTHKLESNCILIEMGCQQSGFRLARVTFHFLRITDMHFREYYRLWPIWLMNNWNSMQCTDRHQLATHTRIGATLHHLIRHDRNTFTRICTCMKTEQEGYEGIYP